MADGASRENVSTGAADLVPLVGSRGLMGAGPHAVSAEGIELVLLRTAKGPRVFQAWCPHQGALLSEGEWHEVGRGGKLVCRNHRWEFDGDTGQRTGGPQCLVACPALAVGDEVHVDRRALPALGALVQRPSPGAERPTVLRTLAEVPGPRSVPFFGNLFSLDLARLHLDLEAWAKTYGQLYRIKLPGATALVVSDASLAETVFRSRPDIYRRTGKLEKVFEELGVAGVFSAEGAAWRSQRKLAMEALAARHLRGFYPTLQKVAIRLRKRWERAADANLVVDVAEDLKRFTVDVTTLLTFGEDLNTLEQSGEAVIQRRLELLFPMFQRRLFAAVPLWRVVRLPRDRAADQAVAALQLWLRELVRDARVRSASKPEISGETAPAANFLEAMVAARDENGEPFSDMVIFGNLMTMLLAGEDTTAYTLAWAVHHLCDHPEAVAALRDEADMATAVGRSPAGIPGDLEAAQALAYAGAVANETMRLRPVAPTIIFETIVDTSLGDVALPAGSAVILLTRPANIEAARFAEPQKFLPARWLAQGGHQPHDPSAHVPFGSGPRICPGRSLALLEMKVVLASVYAHFDVTRAEGAADVRERFAFTMYPDGVKARFARRTR